MKDIYIAFSERLNGGKTPIKHISLWNDNVANLEQDNGFQLPAAFLEIETITWQQHAQGAKTAQVNVNVHIVLDTLADPSHGSMYQMDALEVFDIVESVSDALAGMAGDRFNRWQHIGTEIDHNHDEVQHHIESFTFQYSKASNRTKGEPVEGVKPVIKI